MIKWRKSKRSSTNGQCVELARVGGQLLVQDSKDPGPVLSFEPEVWRKFMKSL